MSQSRDHKLGTICLRLTNKIDSHANKRAERRPIPKRVFEEHWTGGLKVCNPSLPYELCTWHDTKYPALTMPPKCWWEIFDTNSNQSSTYAWKVWTKRVNALLLFSLSSCVAPEPFSSPKYLLIRLPCMSDVMAISIRPLQSSHHTTRPGYAASAAIRLISDASISASW